MGKEFKIGGYDIIFDDKFVKYNELRKRFEVLGIEAEQEFRQAYTDTFSTIDEVHEKGLEFGYLFIVRYLHDAVSLLISHDIFHIDKNSFFKDYLREYIDWEEDFEKIDNRYRHLVFSAEEEKQYREERKEGRSHWQGGGFGMSAAIKASIQADAMNVATGLAHSVINSIANKRTDAVTVDEKEKMFSDDSVLEDLAFSIYYNVYKIHFAIVDALIDNDIEIGLYVSDEDIQKSTTLTNNLNTGLIPLEKEEMLAKKIIYSNPYNEEIYLYLLSKYGDENMGITNICDFLDIEIEDEKQLLLRNFFTSLCNDNEERTKESIKDFEVYAQKMGVTEIESYAAEFNGILRQHDVNIRTVDGILFLTREEALAAETEYRQVTSISSKTDFKSEEEILSAIEEIKNYSTRIGEKYLEIFNRKLIDAIKYQDQLNLDKDFSLHKIVTEEMADQAIGKLEKVQSRNMALVDIRLQEIRKKRMELIEAADKKTLENHFDAMVILSYSDIEREIDTIRSLNIRTTTLSEDLISNIRTNRDKLIKKHKDMLDKAVKYEARISKVRKEKHPEKKGAFGSITKAVKSGSDIIDRTQEKREKEGWDFITLNGASPERVSLLKNRADGRKVTSEDGLPEVSKNYLTEKIQSVVTGNDLADESTEITLHNSSLALVDSDLSQSLPEEELMAPTENSTKEKESEPLTGSLKNNRNKGIIIAVSVILILGTVFAFNKFSQFNGYNDLIRNADLSLQEGQYLNAITMYEESLKLKENNDVVDNITLARLLIEAQAHFDEGVSLYNEKNYMAAMDRFKLIPQVDHEIYEVSQAKIEECKNAFISENIKLANDSISAENFEDANYYIDELLAFDSNNVEANTLKINMERKIQEEELKKAEAERERAEAEKAAAEIAEAEKANNLTFSKYHNDRYGFTVTYPNGLLMEESSANGDGQKFSSPDEVSLTVYGSNNAFDDTAESLYDSMLSSVDASYAEQKDNWYAISGSNGYGLHYKREVVGPGSINTLEFYVPHELADKYDEYLSNMHTYFEAGDVDESH